METGSGGVRMVGIWGVGGGGKTTLASAAYTEISHEFEASCFLENIRDESSKHGLKRLQETFLSFILKTSVKLESEIEGKNMIKRRLCHKSVLVVLDDVDELKQIEALVGSHDWFGKGSRIIITTRDEHLLTRKADTIYEVSLLSHFEAIKLFRRHAYRKDKPVEDYEMLSLAVVSYAGGLPLALEILGSFLYDKDKDEWLSALSKLKCIPDVKVTERLKISYDGLESHEKELFLDIACFMRGHSIGEAMTVLDACSFHPGIGVKVLVQKSLIKVSNGIFDMHDLIEEMAHYIVRGEHPSNPEKHSRIWKGEDIVDFCAMGAAAPLMETEVLGLPSYAGRLGLPHVVANSKKVRWISLKGYPASSFPSNFQPTKLGCLELIASQQKQLWKGCKHLPNLKILDLRGSHYLARTPDFNGLPCLERLYINSMNLKEIHPSFGYHEKLVYVDMKQCSRLKKFPPIKRMKRLETLELSSCDELQHFPDIQTSMDSLVNLHLAVTDIDIIPKSVGKFCTKLVSLDLRDCYKLKRIEGNFRLLKHLKHLQLSGCYQLQKLLGDFFNVECPLEVFSLSMKSQDSKSIKNLMNRIGLQSFHQDNLKFPQFPRFLRTLRLRWCHLGNGDVPFDICDISNLEILDLTGNNFSRLPSSLSRIPCLKVLNLSYCRSLVELPNLPSSIAILKAEDCDSLQNIGDLSYYKLLWKVSLWRRNKLNGGERVLHSLLQVNAGEDRFMSGILPVGRSQPSICYMTTLITLQLPHNWYDNFSGFLLCSDNCKNARCSIVIKEVMSTDTQPDHWEEFDKNPESYEYLLVGYVPFGSLRQTPWWNSAHTKISFQIEGIADLKVGLVPKKRKTDCESREIPKSSIDCSELWDKDIEYVKTFEIKYHPKSSIIEIVWCHGHLSTENDRHR